MYFVDDRNNNSNAYTPRGRRCGGRAHRARARGRGFHFNQSAQEALTHHLMRRGRGLQPAASDPSSLTIGNNHDAPLNAHKLDKNVYPTAANRNNIRDTGPIYLYHPSPCQDLQSPLALTPLSPAHSPVLIENQYLTGVHSAKDPNVSSYTIYMYLPHDIARGTAVHQSLTNQLGNMQSVGLPTSLEGLHALQVQENSTYPVRPELDDEPITIKTEVIPS